MRTPLIAIGLLAFVSIGTRVVAAEQASTSAGHTAHRVVPAAVLQPVEAEPLRVAREVPASPIPNDTRVHPLARASALHRTRLSGAREGALRTADTAQHWRTRPASAAQLYAVVEQIP